MDDLLLRGLVHREEADEPVAEKIVDALTEVIPGRPTKFHHRHPVDNVREPYDRKTVNPISRLHTLTITAAEQQTMNFYMNVGPDYMEPIARQLYQEIGLVEEEHVTHYGSLIDPGETWWEQLVTHEYNECYLYYSCMQTESDPRVKAVWELHLNMELEHLRIACDLMRRHDGRDPAEILAPELPEAVTFEPNKQYVREPVADGDLRGDVDPATTARLLFGMVNSLIEWYRPQGHISGADLADAVATVAFDGLRTRTP